MFSLFLKKEGTIAGGCVCIAQITCFHSSGSFILTQKQTVNHTSYHRNYSLASSGGPQAAEEGIYDGSKSEAVRTQVQRASASFFVRPALHLDLSSSTSDVSSKKCDTAATNVERDP
jgi:hypothetical protein